LNKIISKRDEVLARSTAEFSQGHSAFSYKIMAKQRYINTKFWDDSYVLNLKPLEKYLFLYLLTNSLTNISGVYEISIKRMIYDTSLSEVEINQIFKKFQKDKKIFYFKGWIFIRNFIKNQSINPSVIQGMRREIGEAPTDILNHFIDCDKVDTGGGQEGLLNLTKLNLTKPTWNEFESKKGNPFYKGMPMRKNKYSKKWEVFDNGTWCEFNDKESEIEWK
jgi:hypothetical protein